MSERKRQDKKYLKPKEIHVFSFGFSLVKNRGIF